MERAFATNASTRRGDQWYYPIPLIPPNNQGQAQIESATEPGVPKHIQRHVILGASVGAGLILTNAAGVSSFSGREILIAAMLAAAADMALMPMSPC